MEIKILSEYYRKGEFLMSSGKKIIVKFELLELLTDKSEFPQGYKFSWIAYNRDNPSERVLFDNHIGKSPHWHENGKQKFFTWISKSQAQQLFYKKVIEKFGSFVKRLK